MPVRKHRRDKSEISCCLKYLIFGFNVIFWLMGLSIMVVGVWAWTEKDIFNNLSRLTNIALDPAFVLIVIGGITFIIGFTGCVGALRENTCLLAAYAIFLAILLLLEMTAGILGFIFKDWIKSQATNGFQAFIVFYRDDPDRQNLIDWIQEQWVSCSLRQYYFKNIFWGKLESHGIGSREACGVPFSCCKRQPNELIKNKQCGYDVRRSDYQRDKSHVIYEKGCLRAGEEWIEANLVPVAGVAVGLAVLQILGICFAQNLRADIFAQKAKWH
ncbi:tetraspanin, putative [Ixodes scapularis]|uniref:Tetraspanin, putative n=1 Tax=Ixodes scapularis TaxID=6945 RepID=B7QL73_IXOSC|nr:tetraspanin, putative [Ixodes scapularis]|eukprot:XP_002415928.1 tetraspanin, putative [Ixodes scapularis]